LLLQILLLLLLAPLLSGVIRNWKARLQNRRGPRIWQPYSDLLKFLRKDMVISEHASWVFSVAPCVVFLTALLAGLMVPMLTLDAPLSLFGGVLAVVGLLALGRFFLALGGLDPGSAFGGMGSSREVAIATLIEPALLLALAGAALMAGSTDLGTIAGRGQAAGLSWYTPALLLSAAAFAIVAVAETGHEPVDNPDTHLELTMIHEGMLLEASGPRLAVLMYAAELKLVLVAGLFGAAFLPAGLAASASPVEITVALGATLAKLVGAAVVFGILDASLAKIRILALPGLLTTASIVAAVGLAARLWLPT
jgi:formate hydrogenlyase subunit 4